MPADEPYEGEHVLIIGNDFLNDDVSAGCSCGWEQDGLPDDEAAVDAWENHCDAVFMEATFEDHNVRGFG